MGSGKSVVGKRLAALLGYKYLDLDHYIEKKEEALISDIFKEKGEIYFRNIEGHYLRELLESEKKCVLATGGGTPCYANNMEYIKKHPGLSVYLRTSIKTLITRLKEEKTHRPLIKNIKDADLNEFIAKHLFERRTFYEKAHLIVNTDNKSVNNIVSDIIVQLF